MNRIERYLGSVVFNYFLLVMLVILVIFLFFEFMNQLGDVNDRYTLGLGALYTVLKIPVYGYEAFPVVLLIGTLMGLGGLANQSELTVLRVTGWSIKRILIGVLKTALILWLVMFVLGELVAPQSEAYAKKIKAEATNKSLSIGAGEGFWIKDENRFVYVQKVIASDRLQGIQVYQIENNQMVEAMSAKEARYEKTWLLSDVEGVTLSKEPSDLITEPRLSMNTLSLGQMPFDFGLKPEDITHLDMETRYLSVWALYKQIRFLQQNDLDATPYELSFWRKISLPLIVVAMIAVVFPLIFGSMRQVGAGQRVFLGVLIGMGFHLLNQLIGNIAVVYQLPIMAAVFLPPLMLITWAYFWFKRFD